MRNFGAKVGVWAVVAVAIFSSWLLAQGTRAAATKRAIPPKFNPTDADNIFFPNVFAELRGDRPNFSGGTPGGAIPPPGTGTTEKGGDSPAGPAGAWASIISSSTLEDEIKAIKAELDKDISTPGRFSGGDYKKARKHFSILALMFAAIADYSGDVRFKKEAANARIVFGHTAASCKVGTQGAYDAARSRKDDLEQILSGGSAAKGNGETQFEWSKLADRGPLMQRLEAAHQKIQPAIANKEEFTKQKDVVIHEAEISAAIAELLKKEGMKDADDSAYAKFCDLVKENEAAIANAAKGGNYDEARKAVGEIDKACTQCHMDYRS